MLDLFADRLGDPVERYTGRCIDEGANLSDAACVLVNDSTTG